MIRFSFRITEEFGYVDSFDVVANLCLVTLVPWFVWFVCEVSK